MAGQDTRAVIAAHSRIGDVPMLSDEIPFEQPIGLVTADGPYDNIAATNRATMATLETETAWRVWIVKQTIINV